jgi:peptidoglycan/xylan/chitin deacetylase (PgdA/CDA1 family)
VVAALAAALGFDNKEEVTSQNIKEANEALKEKGITAAAFVVTAEVERLATAAQQVAEANEAKAAAEQAKATAESAKAAAECALATANTEKSVAEGKATAATDALAAVEAKLKDAATKANLEVKDGENATDVVINALSAATARVTELEAQVTTLKGEEAPDSRPGGVVNKEGDTRDATKDDTLSELDNLVKIDDED